MSDCIFCKIVEGKIQSSKVYEDDDILAILDIMPGNKGHTLIIPKKHIETFAECDDELLKKTMVVAKKVAKGIIKVTKCEGYNILINNKPAAGQVVPHLHIHIIPKFNTDEFKFYWPHIKYGEGEMLNYLVMIKKEIRT